MMTHELFFVSLVFLVLVLMALLVLCWTLRRSRNRILTELRISAGQPGHVLTIRTEPDHANQLLDQLLDRVFLQVELGRGSGDDPREQRTEPGQELGLNSGSDPEASTSAAHPNKPVNAFTNKLWKWITIVNPPAGEKQASPAPPPPPNSPDLTPQVSFSSLDGCCSSSAEEEQHDESQL